MSVWRRLVEPRAISAADWGRDVTSTQPSPFASLGNEDKALRLAYSYACIRIIADALASAPLKCYRERNSVKQSVDLPIVFTDPDPQWRLTPYSWKFQAACSLVMRGNLYGYDKAYDPRTATPTWVRWLSPSAVRVDYAPNGDLIYSIGGNAIDASRVRHGRGFLPPGSAVGLSPVDQFRHVIDLGLSADEFTSRWFTDGGHPTSVLSSSTPLNKAQADEAQDRYISAVGRRRGPVVLSNQWKLDKLQESPKESAAVEVTQQAGRETAIVWGVPPWMLGLPSDSMTYSNVEQDYAAFREGTLRHWATSLEETYTSMLPRGDYIKHNLDAFARSDLKTRYDAHAVAIQNGIRTVAEVRDLEDLPPLPTSQVPKDALPMKEVPNGV